MNLRESSNSRKNGQENLNLIFHMFTNQLMIHNNFIGSISLAPKERKIENFLRKKCQLKKHIPNNNNNFDNDKRM